MRCQRVKARANESGKIRRAGRCERRNHITLISFSYESHIADGRYKKIIKHTQSPVRSEMVFCPVSLVHSVSL